MRYFKVLDQKGSAFHGGSGAWSLPTDSGPGEWMPKIENVEPCRRGYHLCREEDLVFWLGPTIYEAEFHGEMLVSENKIVVSEARLLKRTPWNDKLSRLFAADCAESSLINFETQFPSDNRPRLAVEAARKFARGEISQEELSAAESAARSAARSAAASYAANYAAESAAHAAANYAAHAARSAESAARSAESAARTQQSIRLMQYVNGEVN